MMPMDKRRRPPMPQGLSELELALESQEVEVRARDRVIKLLPLFDRLNDLCRRADHALGRDELERLAELADQTARTCDLVRIDEVGQPTECELHEVVDTRLDPSRPHGTIVTVIEPGWLYNGFPVRRAKVVTSRSDDTDLPRVGEREDWEEKNHG
jgi:molecular chaperone GrpE (heat shock protein)